LFHPGPIDLGGYPHSPVQRFSYNPNQDRYLLVSILFRYVFREVVTASLIGGALFTFVLFVQTVGPVMELLVRATAEPGEVGRLFLLTIPQSLPYTVPMGVLVGVLIGLGRLSTDTEITAMRAAGIPGRRVVTPIAAFCLLGALLGGYITVKLSPWAARERAAIGESIKISQATAAIQPRVFHENFPNKVLYVRDVLPTDGQTVHWKGLFLADTSAPESRGSVSGLNAAVDGPRITIAEEAVVIPLPDQERLQIHMPRASAFEQSYDPTQYQAYQYVLGDMVVEAEGDAFDNRSKPYEQMSTSELGQASREGDQQIQAGILYQQRWALPLACLVLPMVGIPLAISTQRAGKSVGVILSVGLSFAYWMLLLGGSALAEDGSVSPAVGVWAANALFGVAGLWMLWQLDAPNRRDYLALAGAPIRKWLGRLRSTQDTGAVPELAGETVAAAPSSRRIGLGAVFEAFFPITDRYILQRFFLYLGLMTAAFVSIWIVFSFFELLSDMLARQKLGLFLPYIYYLVPFLIYETAPLAVMAATLVCFGLLAKHHELIAFRACGVSLYRLATPILICSLGLSGLLFTLDHYYLPESNRRQDAIRDEIKGRPVRTFLRADRQWTFGQRDRIFYHRYFDFQKREMAPVFVYDFGIEPFRLQRHISAERARWDSDQHAWVFENGWVRRFEDNRVVAFEQFEAGRAFSDIRETPDYFQKEDKQHQQMNWRELEAYILDLTQSGFDTARLKVLWHRKFAFPMFAFAMALLAVPFALLAGHRGALAPTAFSLALAIAYYALSALSEQLGRANQMTPFMAAWAPAMVFGMSGAYLFLRVRS